MVLMHEAIPPKDIKTLLNLNKLFSVVYLYVERLQVNLNRLLLNVS